VSTRE